MTPEEIISRWLGTSWTEIGVVVVSTFVIFAAVILATRIGGLRSFSKMSSFDFAMTVAVGSIIATTAVTEASLWAGVAGVAALYAMQVTVAVLRRRTGFEEAVDNTPVLLMIDGEFLQDAMRRSRVTESDLRGKLREANALNYGEVKAVVLETTGDISVLHGDSELDPDLLRGVRGSERLLDRRGDG
jgi:uncharacterized membrane protein YcaP (DUF421 family)